MATVHPTAEKDTLAIHASDQGTGWVRSNCCPDDFLSKEMLPGIRYQVIRALLHQHCQEPAFSTRAAYRGAHGSFTLGTSTVWKPACCGYKPRTRSAGDEQTNRFRGPHSRTPELAHVLRAAGNRQDSHEM